MDPTTTATTFTESSTPVTATTHAAPGRVAQTSWTRARYRPGATRVTAARERSRGKLKNQPEKAEAETRPGGLEDRGAALARRVHRRADRREQVHRHAEEE